MFHASDNTSVRAPLISRRSCLKKAAAATAMATSLSWRDAFAEASEKLVQQGKSCILLWMQGGPSQFETFDPKPGTSNGGETKAISTKVAGIQYSEYLPQLATQSDKWCVIRSMTSKEGSHPRAQSLMHTGYLPGGGVRYPTLGSHVAQRLEKPSRELPGFVRIGRVRGSADGGFLGVKYNPLSVSDPSQPPENTSLPVSDERYERRLDLLNRLQDSFAKKGGATEVSGQRALVEAAAKMIRSPEMQAFELSKESESMRYRYGNSEFGKSCLLARRLIESGVPFVELQLDGWDTHDDNFDRSKKLCEQFDNPTSVLVNDLADRGLLDQTLILWMGEFGRTPKINPRAGRDHYPRAFSVAMAGCGVHGGQVIGATDAQGADITEQPVQVADLFHTVFHGLGIDPNLENFAAGRPIKLANEGHPLPIF